MTKALMQKLKNRKGFTLIELIVVIAIIAILAAVLIPRFTGFSEDAREKSALSDARNILLALEALDASGEFSSSTGFMDEVNDYTGKTIITSNGVPTPRPDEGAWFTTAPTQGVNGINFVFVKRDNGKDYTVTSLNSVLSGSEGA